MTTCTHSHVESGTCPVCRFEPFSRNHYFDGKFMVARDFTDEQRYYVDKLRHHHARLHGWGVVCGLKVKQHPNEACRDRFVCIEPGSAIDCCGREILVTEEECLDLTTLPAIKALREKNDEATHSLQICVRYRECPTEDVPVLYDECGCDETKCSPNRILESYEFDVIVDPEPERALLHTPRLTWEHTLNLAHARRVVVHEASERLYVLNEDTPGVVYQLDTATHATITSHSLPAKGVAVAISNNGERLYLIVEGSSETENSQLYTLDVTQPGLHGLSEPLEIPDSAGNDVVLIVEPGGSLLALVTNNGALRRWAVNEHLRPTTSTELTTVGVGFTSMALSSDGAVAYVAGSSSSIQSVAIETRTQDPISGILPTGAQVSALAVVKSTGPDLLAVVDKDGPTFHLVALNPEPVVGTVSLDHPPVALTVSSGGHWAYVLEQDEEANESYIQAVNVHALQQHLPTEATPQFKVSHPAQQVTLDASGQRLYIPFTGEQDQAVSGGVAIVDLSEEVCKEIPWRSLEECPHCDIPNCVVLATIKDYTIGEAIEVGKIDNRARRLLPSTQTLYEMIECLMEHGGSGGPGTQGLPGSDGQPGLGIDQVNATIIECDEEPATPSIEVVEGQRTLNIHIPRGCDGQHGRDGRDGTDGHGLEAGLTRINALSWTHNENSRLLGIRRQDESSAAGLVIGFTGPISFLDIWNKPIDSEHIFQVLVPASPVPAEIGLGFLCRCPIRGTVIPVSYRADRGLIFSAEEVTPPDDRRHPRGIAFLFTQDSIDYFGRLNADVDLWVQLRGDFVLDAGSPGRPPRAIDAEFVRAELPTGNRPDRVGTRPPTELGMQGGLFESWFTIVG